MSENTSGWRPYEEVKHWVQRKGFRNYKELLKYTKNYVLPPGFPSSPRIAYADEYEGDTIFFGDRPPIIMPYERAIQYVRTLNLGSAKEYYEYVEKFERNKRDNRLPRTPEHTYKEDWCNWGEFLGTGTISNSKREFLPYEQAVAFVHQLRLKNQYEWFAYANNDRPHFIPYHPHEVYKDQYVGLRSWLGTDVVQNLLTRNAGHDVMCLLRDPDEEPGVYQYKIFRGGKADALVRCEGRYRILRMYQFEPDTLPFIQRTVRAFSSFVDDREFMTNQINQIAFELDVNLLPIRA